MGLRTASLMEHAKHVAWRRVGRQVVLLDLRASSYYSLNETAGDVWALIGRGLSEESIAEELADAYRQRLPRVKKEVSALLQRLKEEKLVVAGAA